MQPTSANHTADLAIVLDQLLFVLPDIADDEWQQPAGGLTWTRWETAEHIADDLLTYATRLAAPNYRHDTPFEKPGSVEPRVPTNSFAARSNRDAMG